MSTPIVMTSLFSFPTLEELQSGLATENRTHVYTRGQNPTVEELERKLAALERGDSCKGFASGMAAISAVLLGLLKSGDHVLFVNQTYGPTLQLAAQLGDYGITHSVQLDTDENSIVSSITPSTKLIWLESPGTMTFGLLDLAAISRIAKERGIITCIDNSWATPLLLKPIVHGIDIVVHTCSKYINGHSDLMAGAVITSEALMSRIFYRGYMLLGGIMSPHEAWLVLRGLRTLPARLRQHGHDALAIATALKSNDAVREVLHPAFISATDSSRKQLAGYSGVFAFVLKDDSIINVRRVINSLKHFKIGVSWGGVESLVLSPANGNNEVSLAERRIPRGLVRISVGLEGADILLSDLKQALTA